MDADRPDSIINDYKTDSETIGGHIVAATVLKAANHANRINGHSNNVAEVEQQRSNGDGNGEGDRRSSELVASHTDTVLSNDVLSALDGAVAATAAVATVATVAAIASDNTASIRNRNGRVLVIDDDAVCDVNSMITQQSIGLAECNAVAVATVSDTSSVLPSAASTAAATAIIQNHLCETNRVSASDDYITNCDNNCDDARTINGVHAKRKSNCEIIQSNGDLDEECATNQQKQQQQLAAGNCDSNNTNGASAAMYQRIPSDEDGDDEGGDHGTNSGQRMNGAGRQPHRRSPSQRKVKRTSNGGVYNSFTHLDNDHDDDDDSDNETTRQSKRALYNEYVNLLCDTDIGAATTTDSQRRNARNGDDTNARMATESKPLLLDLAGKSGTAHRKPKSIVKSPSTQTFKSGEKYADGGGRKQRFSIQCTEPERPVLHVQFLPKQAKVTTGLSQSYPPQSQSTRRSSADMAVQPGSLDGLNANGGSFSARSSVSSTDSSSSSDDSSSESSSSDGDSTIGQIAEAKPPDGGWGWVVVFASFMVNLIADGITFSFGVIYVEFLNYFGEGKTEAKTNISHEKTLTFISLDTGKAKTAWIGSVFMAMPLLSGPVASFLTDRYGCRRVTIAGSILASLGFFISAFIETMEMLFLTFGILAGFGLSLCYVAAVVIVAYYFDKRRSFATGLSVCGSGIGTFIFAPLTQMLIAEYGWRGCTLILSGLFLNMCVCGMLMRDLEWTTYRAKLKAKQRKKRSRLGISADSFSVSNSTNTAGTTSNMQPNHDMNGGDHHADANGSSLHNGDVDGKSDPRLFSSLITLPTFVKTGEKVRIVC